MMKYERLTERRKYSTGIYVDKLNGEKEWQDVYDLVENERSGSIDEVFDRLAELEDDLERGKIVRLPCKVGDTVWTINCWQEYGKKELGERYIVTRYELHENKCSCIEINDKNYYRGEISIKEKENYKGVTPWVFLTREEAEAKLKELQNG